MSTKTVFFGYLSFLREKVDAAKNILEKRAGDYLTICFDPSKIIQDGPMSPYPNMSFSIILEGNDHDDTIADIETAVQQLPFLAATLVAEEEGKGRRIFTWSNESGNGKVEKQMLVPANLPADKKS